MERDSPIHLSNRVVVDWGRRPVASVRISSFNAHLGNDIFLKNIKE